MNNNFAYLKIIICSSSIIITIILSFNIYSKISIPSLPLPLNVWVKISFQFDIILRNKKRMKLISVKTLKILMSDDKSLVNENTVTFLVKI